MKLLIISILVIFSIICNARGQVFFNTYEDSDEDVIDPDYNETDFSLVHYLLWTRSNSGDDDDYELLYENSTSLTNSPFVESKRTYFIFHGWGGNPKESWILETKTNLLIWWDCQVIAVNYSVLADASNYDKAVHYMYEVANYSASYVDWLVFNTELKTSQIHIIGHSLGGQAAGMTGHYITAGLVDRVTGLDPAGPEFYNKTEDERIDKTSGAFVDIIHSNSGTLTENCVGLFKAVGHVDFYPNGGKHQPGCKIVTDATTSCSHGRSHDYFSESILETTDNENMHQFWSYECSDYDLYLSGSCFDAQSVVMGFHTRRDLSGTFYLETNETSPYALGPQT